MVVDDLEVVLLDVVYHVVKRVGGSCYSIVVVVAAAAAVVHA